MTTEELLVQFNIDPQNRKIRDYYEADNLWLSLRINNDENSHSAFLAWLLGLDPTKPNSPLYNFLNLLVQRNEFASKVQIKDDYQELKKAVLLGAIRFVSDPIIKPEKVVSSLSKIRYNDRLDIYATCDVSGVGKFNKLEIFIENKIGSSEGKYKVKKNEKNLLSPEEKIYKDKMQTERYYYACSREFGLRNSSFQSNCTIQLFVFLTPQEDQIPTDKEHYIKISYQDLVDYIIEPLLNREDLDNHTVFLLKEYLRMLGNPQNKIIMATEKAERELLKEFYTKNEDLFIRALQVMCDNAETEEDQKNYEQILSSAKKTRSNRNRFFTINGNGEYRMYAAVAEFVKYQLKCKKTLADIEKEIKIYTNEPKRDHISDLAEGVFRYNKHKHEDVYDNKRFYVTKEWGYDSTKKSNSNFTGLLKQINSKYKDFQIEEIIQ